MTVRGPALCCLLSLCLLWNQDVIAQSDPGATVVTHHEMIPNPLFGSTHRVAAVCKGVSSPCSWESPGTWSTNVVPDLNTKVIVDGNVQIHNTSAQALDVGV